MHLADYSQRHHSQVENYETERNAIYSLISCARQVILSVAGVLGRTPSLKRIKVDESSASEILHDNRRDYKFNTHQG